jgi:DNA-binding NarL/FixJ family response regulator
MPSPIVRETIKKLKERRAQLQKQVKGPLEELRQIDEDLIALGAAPPSAGGSRRRPAAPRRAPGATQAAILRAIRNGATEPAEIAEKTGLAPRTVSGGVTTYLTKQKLLVRGPNGLTLTRAGRERLAELEAGTR